MPPVDPATPAPEAKATPARPSRTEVLKAAVLREAPQAVRDQIEGKTTLTKSQEATDAAEAHNPGSEGSTPSPATTLPENTDGAESITFGAPEEKPAATAEETPVKLTAEQLAALNEETRKRITDQDKENVKLRKRSQEAEEQLKQKDQAISEKDKALADALEKLNEAQTRGGLAGNVFNGWQNSKAVGSWGAAGKELLQRFEQISVKVTTGNEVPEDMLKYKLPDGREITLDEDAYNDAHAWVNDAAKWFEHDSKVSDSKAKAKPLVEKYSQHEGYTAKHDEYRNDPHIAARMPEILAKAALVDLLEERSGTIYFGKAGAAKNASPASDAAGPARAPKTTPTPPRETAASTPRLVPQSAAAGAQSSEALSRAKTTGRPDDVRAALRAMKFKQ